MIPYGLYPEYNLKILEKSMQFLRKEGENMNRIQKSASVGAEETNDLLIEVEAAPVGSGVELDFKTSVPYQYGDHLQKLILDTIEGAGYTDLKMTVRDKGSWDYTVKSRVLTVLERGRA